MANNYESLKTDGHYTMARRIFQKIKNKYLTYVNYSPVVSSNEIVGIGFTETNDSGIIQYFVLGKGDNITFTQVGNSGTYNISADQIEDSYNYQQYQNLPTSIKMQDKLFIVENAPDLDPAILNLVYPIGTYYETSDTTFDPNVTWGGTWSLETEGLVHISSGANYVVSANTQDGGSAQITYTPSGSNSGGVVQRDQLNINFGGDGTHNHDFTQPTFTGTQATLDNMQPYKIVNRWHRTA